MKWHKIELLYSKYPPTEHENIESKIREFVKRVRNNDSKGIAMFSELSNDALVMYFSPKTCELMKFIIDPYSPLSCDEPVDKSKLSFSGGDELLAKKILRQKS